MSNDDASRGAPLHRQPIVRAGQIWSDNDGRGARLVRVYSVGPTYAQIQSCGDNGYVKPGSRMTCTMLSRFGKGGRKGFTFVKDAP